MNFVNSKSIFLNEGVKFFNLGNIYYYGIGVEKNLKTALELYLKAESNNVSEAQNMLGIMYFNGEGVEANIEKSIEYFEKAKKQGNTTAIFNLVMVYIDFDLKQYERLVYEYLQQLINIGYSLAIDVLSDLHYKDRKLEVKNNKNIDLKYNVDEDINKNREITIKEFSIDNEKMSLAEKYYEESDYEQAFEHYKTLAELGNIDAQFKVANMYKEGLGVNKNYAKSIEWYSKTIDGCESLK